jgi:UDP-N-acetylmuramoyl-L-alanyl-D-glutamate--2,6-diaminopimelate ligase
MLLREIFQNVKSAELAGTGNPEIGRLVCDSRKVEPGALFAALPGKKTDGAEFAADAVAKGASAVLLPRNAEILPVPCVRVDNPRQALAEAACAFYGNPSAKLKLIGVTGTNGKTTVAYLLRHIFRNIGAKAGMMGTIEYDNGAVCVPAPLTTPESVDFTRYLAEMADNGAQYAVAEVSSHALSQFRVWGQRFACGVFTNLTRDHLDYHGGMGDYLQAKKILFDSLHGDAVAIVNQDDPSGTRVVENTEARVLRYGLGKGADLCGKIQESTLAGLKMEASGGMWAVNFATKLVGDYNALNCLAALGAAGSLGIDWEDAANALATFPGVPGRMEKIESKNGVTAFVDYAHTPDALKSVLQVLRPLAKKRLIVVFGCGGDRDCGKRPMMARAAEAVADLVIVTSDNPRTEEPVDIISDIMAGFENPELALVVPDRAEAVAEAVSRSLPGDVILLAGKGHENYQLIGTVKTHMDDRELLRNSFGK